MIYSSSCLKVLKVILLNPLFISTLNIFSRSDIFLVIYFYISLVSNYDQGMHLKDGQFKKCLLTIKLREYVL